MMDYYFKLINFIQSLFMQQIQAQDLNPEYNQVFQDLVDSKINVQPIKQIQQQGTNQLKCSERNQTTGSQQTIIGKETKNHTFPMKPAFQNKKSSYLPKIFTSSLKFEQTKKIQLPDIINRTSQIVKSKNQSRKKNQNSTLPQPNSLHLSKNKQKTLKDQLYLPAFIRNFELPPKRKVQIIPTMDIFKKRQANLKKFLSSPQTLKKYKILSHIGKGSFSTVYQAVNLQTRKKMAIKTYVKLDQIQNFKFINIEREIENMHKISNHKNVVKIEAVIIEKRKLMMIIQNCGQQSLSGILRKKKVLSQLEAKHYFRQLVEGISYCHQNSICHRDLKLENLLVDDQNNIKIIDFGFSCQADRPLSSFCGTAPYMAPEIISHKLYDGKTTDIWAIGVILYFMLYGKFPFRSSNEKQLFRLIQQGKICHNQIISFEAKQVINMILKINSIQRPSLTQILESKWLQQKN